MTLDDARNIATILGVLLAAIALMKGIIEYRRQGAQKRAEQFVAMRRRFKDNVAFTEMCDLLEDDDPNVASLPFKKKRDFIGFFEEIAIMCNSGLIRPDVAHYMFGFYVIDCWSSEHFWSNIDRDSKYVALFKDFALQMQTIDESYRFDRQRYRI